jgi:hypothetical protein
MEPLAQSAEPVTRHLFDYRTNDGNAPLCHNLLTGGALVRQVVANVNCPACIDLYERDQSANRDHLPDLARIDTIWLASFAPAHDSRASVGGFQWSIYESGARECFDRYVNDSRVDQCHVVRFHRVTLPESLVSTTGYSEAWADTVTNWVDSELERWESTDHALSEYVPGDSQYPPSGGADEVLS